LGAENRGGRGRARTRNREVEGGGPGSAKPTRWGEPNQGEKTLFLMGMDYGRQRPHQGRKQRAPATLAKAAGGKQGGCPKPTQGGRPFSGKKTLGGHGPGQGWKATRGGRSALHRLGFWPRRGARREGSRNRSGLGARHPGGRVPGRFAPRIHSPLHGFGWTGRGKKSTKKPQAPRRSTSPGSEGEDVLGRGPEPARAKLGAGQQAGQTRKEGEKGGGEKGGD